MKMALNSRCGVMLCMALAAAGSSIVYAADAEHPAPDSGASSKMKAGGAAVKHDAKAVGDAAKEGAEKIKIESKKISHEVAEAAKKGAHEVKVVAKEVAEEAKKIVGHGSGDHSEKQR
jgi:gas vesicle protein